MPFRGLGEVEVSNYRNRKLLNLAHLVPLCINCGGMSSCMGEATGCEPAHENGIEAGKGGSIKSHDNRHAALGHGCHSWYDSGSGRDPTGMYCGDAESKTEMFNRAHKRTFDLYWQMGWLWVNP